MVGKKTAHPTFNFAGCKPVSAKEINGGQKKRLTLHLTSPVANRFQLKKLMVGKKNCPPYI